MGVLQNLEKGQIGAALHDIANSVESMFETVESKFPALGDLITKLESDGEGVIADAIAVAAADVQSANYSTASFVTAAKDALAVIVSKGVPLLLSDVFAFLNMQVSQLQATAATASTAQAPTGG